jgi:lysophospholipase L1-like esterase
MATAANQLRIVNAGVIETQNGRPAITSIDGTGYLTFNQNIASGEVRTVSSVFKIRTLKLNNELFGADGSKMVDFGSQISGGTDINGNRIWFRNGSTNTYSTVGTWSYDLTSTIPQIGTFKWASSRLKAWRNSTEIVTTPTASFNWSATSINIMRGNAGLIRGLSGTIQEFIWYASDISDIDRAIIENNQSVYFQANSTPSGPISAVANFSDSIINLSWQEPSSIGMSAITDYIIEYKLSSSITWLTYNDGISTIKNATINGLTNGISYDFRVSAVNDQGIGTASTIVTGVPVKLISINDTNIYFSPYNWAPIGTEKRQAVSSGAYIKVAFTGNTIGLKLDNSNSFDGLDFNLVTAYIDGSSVPVSKLLSASNPNGFLLISNSLSEGNHYAVIYFSRQDYEPGTNRWDFNSPGVTIAAVVRVESLLVSGGSLPLVGTPIQTSNKKGLSFGDSITEGIGVGSGANRSSSLDPRSEFAYSAVMNKFIGKEYGQIGYGSQAWLSQGGGFVPTWAGSGNSWRYYSQGLERINSTTNLALGFKEGAPDYITMNLGFNDSNRSTTIPVATSKQFFVDMRQVSSAETELFMILPFAMSGSTFSTQNQFTTNKNNLIAGYNQYKLENPNDTRVHLIDLGTWGGQIVSNNSSDNIHPNKTGSNYLGTALGQIISPYLNGNFTASSTSINMVSNVTITLTGTNMLWAGTVVSGSTTNPSLSPTTFQLINSGSNASIVSQSIGSNNQATIVINPGNTSGTITIFDPNSNAKITIEVI